MTALIRLPWPDKRLSPNARTDRRQVADVKRKYRQACGWAATGQKHALRACEGCHVSLTFHPPDGRKRDLDNMLASIKSGLDGLADVWGVDDSEWSLSLTRGEPVKGGCVMVEVE